MREAYRIGVRVQFDLRRAESRALSAAFERILLMGLPSESRLPLVSFRNILYAMDFSPGSLLAFPFAAGIADGYGAKIFVAHVVSEEDFNVIPSRRETLALKIQASMEEALSAGPVARLNDIPHEILFDHGSISARILAAAEKCRIDLIVIGTHGWIGFKKLLKGSTAEEIACLSTTPVLTVGPKVSRQFDFRLILYATDFLPTATHALPYAVSLARAYSARLVLLHVNDWSSREPPSEARSKTYDYFCEHLNRFGNRRTGEDPEVVVDYGQISDRILEHASARNADLIVMGRHHREGLHARAAAHLPGSTSYDVASQASCPVLTVPFQL